MKASDILGNIRSANSNVDFSTIPLENFKEVIEDLDWFYDYSDDYGVWESGKKCFDRLSEFLRTAPTEFRQIYNLVRFNTFDSEFYAGQTPSEVKDYIPVYPDDGFPDPDANSH